MEIILPETIQKPLFEGTFVLQPDETDFITRTKGESSRLSKKELRMLDTPSVTIGVPECRPLKDYIKEIGGMLSASPGSVYSRDTFFVILCACSFRPPQKKRSSIERATFSVALRAQYGQRHPIAFDIYPRKVEAESGSTFQIKVAPSLKISGIQFEPGEMEATVNSNNLISVITGTGLRESDVRWDFKKHNREGVHGTYSLCMIVNRPYKTGAMTISMDVVAEIKTIHGFFLAKIEGLRDQLVKEIC